MKKGLKIVLGIGSVLIVLGIIGMVALYFMLGSIIKAGIETVGPKLTQSPVTVSSVKLSPLSGHMEIRNFVVGNPQGYNTEFAVKVGTVRVNMVPSSVFGDRIVVKEVFIDGPELTYEGSLGGSNLAQIQKNIEAFTGKPSGEKAPETPKPTEPAKPGKKLQIDDVTIQNTKINLSMKLLAGQAISLPMPTLHLTGLGKEKDGKSVGDVVNEIFGAIMNQVTGVVAGAGDVLKGGAAAIGGTASQAGKTVSDTASKAFGGVKGLFKSGTTTNTPAK